MRQVLWPENNTVEPWNLFVKVALANNFDWITAQIKVGQIYFSKKN